LRLIVVVTLMPIALDAACPGCDRSATLDLACASDTDCAKPAKCIAAVCSTVAAAGEGEPAGEGEGRVGEGEGASEGEGEGAGEGEGEGAGAGEGEGEGPVANANQNDAEFTACSAPFSCALDGHSEVSGQCAGLYDGAAPCDACPDCSTACAPCCTGAIGTCSGTAGCGTCLEVCSFGCDLACDSGAVCSTLQNGGNTPSIVCTDATCRSDLSDGLASDLMECSAGAACDGVLHHSPSFQTTCDGTSSSCTFLYENGGAAGSTESCTNTASCNLTINALTANTAVTCQSSSSCTSHATSSQVTVDCSGQAACALECTTPPFAAACAMTCAADAAACTLSCDGTPVPCSAGQTCTCP
jgi:hypothetical protein